MSTTIDSSSPAPPVSPPRVLGVGALAFAMFNCIVGASIFKLPAAAAAMLGPAAVLAYLVCSLVLALVGLCLAEAGSRVTEAGGLYAYSTVAFGAVVGGIVGTLSWVAYVAGAAAVADLWAETIATLWAPAASASGRAALVVGVWGVLAAVNVRAPARERVYRSFWASPNSRRCSWSRLSASRRLSRRICGWPRCRPQERSVQRSCCCFSRSAVSRAD